jgi:hypothetical protein
LELDDRFDRFRERRDDERPKIGKRRWPVLVVALALGGAAAVYWNYERLQMPGLDWLAIGRSQDASRARVETPREVEREVAVAPTDAAVPTPGPNVADAAVTRSPVPAVSASAPTGAAPVVSEPASQHAESADEAKSRATLTQPKALAAKPPEPETFEPESPVVMVSEHAASVAITVRRRGGDQGSSSLVWWTSDGTAVANDDYVDLGARIEKFAPGEQTRTIYIPLIHDSKAEGRESFYVNLRAGQDGKRLEPAQRVEVVIEDDD